MGEIWFTTAQAAKYMGVAVGTIKAYRNRGFIKARQLPSGHWRYRAADLDAAVIERNRDGDTPSQR